MFCCLPLSKFQKEKIEYKIYFTSREILKKISYDFLIKFLFFSHILKHFFFSKQKVSLPYTMVYQHPYFVNLHTRLPDLVFMKWGNNNWIRMLVSRLKYYWQVRLASSVVSLEHRLIW